MNNRSKHKIISFGVILIFIALLIISISAFYGCFTILYSLFHIFVLSLFGSLLFIAGLPLLAFYILLREDKVEVNINK